MFTYGVVKDEIKLAAPLGAFPLSPGLVKEVGSNPLDLPPLELLILMKCPSLSPHLLLIPPRRIETGGRAVEADDIITKVAEQEHVVTSPAPGD